jgi:hypothetical protein
VALESLNGPHGGTPREQGHMTDDRGAVASGTYLWDDGLSFAYREGKQSELEVTARRIDSRDGVAHIDVHHRTTGNGTMLPQVLLLGAWKSVRITCDGADVECSISQSTLRIAGFDHPVTITAARNPE